MVPARTAFWGTLVQGFDDGEGWLRLASAARDISPEDTLLYIFARVGAYFLPMKLSGVQVLTPEVGLSLLLV